MLGQFVIFWGLALHIIDFTEWKRTKKERVGGYFGPFTAIRYRRVLHLERVGVQYGCYDTSWSSTHPTTFTATTPAATFAQAATFSSGLFHGIILPHTESTLKEIGKFKTLTKYLGLTDIIFYRAAGRGKPICKMPSSGKTHLPSLDVDSAGSGGRSGGHNGHHSASLRGNYHNKVPDIAQQPLHTLLPIFKEGAGCQHPEPYYITQNVV